jgi:hypothetical protein
MWPQVLIRIIDDYAPEFVQCLVQDDADHNDMESARIHLMWCDPRHICIEEIWPTICRQRLDEIGIWLTLLRNVPDRIAEWQILDLSDAVLLFVWQNTNWVRRSHVEKAFRSRLAMISKYMSHDLTPFADVIFPSRDLETMEKMIFHSLLDREYGQADILHWWIAYLRSKNSFRTIEDIANDNVNYTLKLSKWVTLSPLLLNREAMALIEAENRRIMAENNAHNRRLFNRSKSRMKRRSPRLKVASQKKSSRRALQRSKKSSRSKF